jgi:hypothetical protein
MQDSLISTLFYTMVGVIASGTKGEITFHCVSFSLILFIHNYFCLYEFHGKLVLRWFIGLAE